MPSPAELPDMGIKQIRTIAEDKLCGFVDFYMRKDTKQNNGKTIVANWEGDFNPEERWQQWSMRSKRSAQRPN